MRKNSDCFAVYSLNHRVNFGQFKLCNDIEKNPGPSVYVDATKTINAPYCQGNVTGFGGNGEQRVCEARALRARKSLTPPRVTDFFTDFEKKPTVLQSIQTVLSTIKWIISCTEGQILT